MSELCRKPILSTIFLARVALGRSMHVVEMPLLEDL